MGRENLSRPFFIATTAVMSWITDAGVTIHVSGITFVVGSTVFYTSLLLGVFVIYGEQMEVVRNNVFENPRATLFTITRSK